MFKVIISSLILTISTSTFGQSHTTDSADKNIATELSAIKNSTKEISNKIDSCCKRKIVVQKRKLSSSNVKIENSITINNDQSLTQEQGDSCKVVCYCCKDSSTKDIVPIKTFTEKKNNDTCFRILFVTLILLAIKSIVILILYKIDKEKFITIAKSSLEKAIPHLPFTFLTWAIGFTILFSTLCKIDFSDSSSITYPRLILLSFALGLILLPFLKTLKIGKYLELERNIKETKEEVKEFKTEIRQSFQTLSSTLAASVNSINRQTQSVTNTFGAYPTLPDKILPELEAEIDKIVKAKLDNLQLTPTSELNPYVPEDNLYMFRIRYNIETQLRRIWENRFITEFDYDRPRAKPIIKIIQDLTDKEIIDKELFSILREILSICNNAIHGEVVSEKQNHFIKNSAIQIINYLKETK